MKKNRIVSHKMTEKLEKNFGRRNSAVISLPFLQPWGTFGEGKSRKTWTEGGEIFPPEYTLTASSGSFDPETHSDSENDINEFNTCS